MSTKNLNIDEIKNIFNDIHIICEEILLSYGPFLKEGIYQDILVQELNLKKILNTREMVFNYKFNDSHGRQIIIGNNQFLRSDIELNDLGGILELKSSGGLSKDENLWQLRNYLENRTDKNWGILINFISKFGPKTSPRVQTSLLIKDEGPTSYLTVESSKGKRIKIKTYYHEDLISIDYPMQNLIFKKKENDNSTITVV